MDWSWEFPAFEQIVDETIIRRFNHENLNVEVSEFRKRCERREHCARVIYQLLKPRLSGHSAARLASVHPFGKHPKPGANFLNEDPPLITAQALHF